MSTESHKKAAELATDRVMSLIEKCADERTSILSTDIALCIQEALQEAAQERKAIYKPYYQSAFEKANADLQRDVAVFDKAAESPVEASEPYWYDAKKVVEEMWLEAAQKPSDEIAIDPTAGGLNIVRVPISREKCPLLKTIGREYAQNILGKDVVNYSNYIGTGAFLGVYLDIWKGDSEFWATAKDFKCMSHSPDSASDAEARLSNVIKNSPWKLFTHNGRTLTKSRKYMLGHGYKPYAMIPVEGHIVDVWFYRYITTDYIATHKDFPVIPHSKGYDFRWNINTDPANAAFRLIERLTTGGLLPKNPGKFYQEFIGNRG